MWDTTSVTVIIGAYFIGAVPSAYIAARFASGIDIRSHGSGNIGVSNIFRQGGFWLAAPVVLYDVVVKGAVPIIIASDKVLDLGLDVEVTAAFAAIMGHHWSAFVKFRGGRGMAAVMGAMVTLSWPLPFLYALPALFGFLRKGDSAIWWALAALILPIWTVTPVRVHVKDETKQIVTTKFCHPADEILHEIARVCMPTKGIISET